jgi:DNA-binding transcriptional regulator WhiA
MTSRKNRYAYKTENLTKELLQKEYNELKSVRKLAKKHNVHHKTMSQILNKFDIYFEPKIIRTKNENIFSEETEKSFYLAGFIAADGNIHHKNNNYHLHIGLYKDDLNHLIMMQKLLNSNSNIRTYENNSIIDGRTLHSTIKAFTVCSKQIYEDLNKNFLISPNKSLTLMFPEHLSTHPMIHHFIRGYFDGDGSWSIRNPNIKNKQSKINICFELLGTKHFIENVNNILHNNLNLPSNKIEQKKNIYRIRYSGNKLSSTIGDWLYKDAAIYLDRKYQKYLLSKSFN